MDAFSRTCVAGDLLQRGAAGLNGQHDVSGRPDKLFLLVHLQLPGVGLPET